MYHNRPESFVFAVHCYSDILYLTLHQSAADVEATSKYNHVRIQFEIPSLEFNIIAKDVLLAGDVLFYLARIDIIMDILPNLNM